MYVNKVFNLNLNTSFKGKKGNVGGETQNAAVNGVLKYFEEEESLASILKRFNSNDFLKKEDSGNYKMGDYEFCVGSAFNLYDAAEKLQTIGSLGLDCAPEFIAARTSKNGKYQVIVTKTPNCTVNYNNNQDKINSGEKRNFYEQIKSLYDTSGLFNPSVVESTDNWQVTDEGKIYIPDWTELSCADEINSKQTDEYFSKLRQMCNLTY